MSLAERIALVNEKIAAAAQMCIRDRTWCYDNGGSIWSPIALHMVLNALILASAVLGA